MAVGMMYSFNSSCICFCIPFLIRHHLDPSSPILKVWENDQRWLHASWRFEVVCFWLQAAQRARSTSGTLASAWRLQATHPSQLQRRPYPLPLPFSLPPPSKQASTCVPVICCLTASCCRQDHGTSPELQLQLWSGLSCPSRQS